MAFLSILRSIYFLITRRLIFSHKYKWRKVYMSDGSRYEIFRHMKLKKNQNATGAILIIRFKFKKFSHEKNVRLSRIPIPLIGGFPGFQDKVWMYNRETGYWIGLYQWSGVESIKKYRKSFVLGVMNKRAVEDSVSYDIIPDIDLDDYLKSIIA